MKTKIMVAAAAGLFCAGAVTQIWLPQLGLTAMLVGIMCGLAVIVLRQQTILRRVARHERLITQVQRTAANGKVEAATYGASILRRVKLLTDEAGQLSTRPASQASASAGGATASGSTRATAGRASTPEVSNPFTDESMHTMLAPGRVPKLAGIFAPRSMPDSEHDLWIPGDVVASLERSRPQMVIIDEQELQTSARWSSALSGAGTALMRELLEGVRWSRGKGIPTYLLTGSLTADVHTSVLRRAPLVVLPLDTAAQEAAAGAPPTPQLLRLQAMAGERAGASQ